MEVARAFAFAMYNMCTYSHLQCMVTLQKNKQKKEREKERQTDRQRQREREKGRENTNTNVLFSRPEPLLKGCEHVTITYHVMTLNNAAVHMHTVLIQ